MSIETRFERVAAPDGGEFDAFCALPESGRGAGILLFQEIFGINDNIRDLATRLAGEGYVVLAPDMFWRIEPRFERKDESGFGDAIAMVQKFDMTTARADIDATHAHLRSMDACTGKVGAVGFCLGGALAFIAAAGGVDAAVPYYGSGVNDLLGLKDEISCPLLFQYGNNDAFIPNEKVDEVEAVFADRANVEVLRYDAGHAFSNNDAPSMYDETTAKAAWAKTLAFFGEHLS